MNIEHLHEFLILAKTKSYSRSCELLYMNQSTLSKHIKALEAELDVRLFERSTRTVSLTLYGQQFLPYAEKISHTYFEYNSVLTRQKNHILSIGVIPSVACYGLLDILWKFQKENPDININIDEGDSYDLKKDLIEHKYDFTFMRRFHSVLLPDLDVDDNDNNITYEHYFTDRMMALVPKKSSYNFGQTISLQDLENIPLCLLQRGTLQYDICTEAFEAVKVVPNIFYTSHRLSNIIDVALKSNCVSLVLSPPFNTQDGLELLVRNAFHAIPITPEINSTVSFCYLNSGEKSDPLRKFIKYYQDDVIPLSNAE